MPLVVPGITQESSINKPDGKKEKDGDAKPLSSDFKATPGPVIPKDTSVFENTMSREEQHAKAKELNEEK